MTETEYDRALTKLKRSGGTSHTASDDRIEAALRVAATNAGMIDTDDVALIDASMIEVDANGDPTNAVRLIAEFKVAKPRKFGKPLAEKHVNEMTLAEQTTRLKQLGATRS